MKSMAFIDYQNFQINKNSYLSENKLDTFNIDFIKLVNEVNAKITIKPTLVKTFLFAPKPCEQLMNCNNEYYRQYYNWLCGMKNKSYFEVIEGTQEIRPASKDIPIDLNDYSTYTTKEKGTDVNVAVNMLSKAYHNAYDVAILVSGDTDYIPVVKELHNLGKTVVLATLLNQNVNKYDEYKDAHIKIDINMLKNCSVNKKK